MNDTDPSHRRAFTPPECIEYGLLKLLALMKSHPNTLIARRSRAGDIGDAP